MWAAATGWIVRALGVVPPDAPAATAAVTETVAQGSGDPNVILYLLGGGSAVTIIGMIGRGISALVSGRVAEASRQEMSLVKQRDKAWEERDAERTARERDARTARERIEEIEDEARRRIERAERNLRRVVDHAGTLRYLCKIHGVPAEEIEPFPRLERNPDDPAPTSGPTPPVS